MATRVERLGPTNGVVSGWLGVAMAVVVGLVSVAADPGRTGLGILLGAALVGLVIWMVVLRPRAAILDEETLLLRQELTDTWVPLALVDSVEVRQTLVVRVGDQRYVCTGIGRSRAPVLRPRRPPSGAPAVPDPATHVQDRITALAWAAAGREESREAAPRVRRRWAVPELVVLAGLVAGVLVTVLGG